ncbi:hypothetical protein VTJ49DRAFT_5682 [Mycothermus thermophilus]|uniref:Transcription factor Iwr1 domain-containing protein n=1 Tax=Humicola insolens TaxID=85995 RepID=A0ABR3V2L6_HUMIN
MDDSFTHPAHSSRQIKRDANISLAPLATRLPLRTQDYEELKSVSSTHISYLSAGSNPTTPHHDSPSSPRPLTARSERHISFPDMASDDQARPLSKSKSTTYLDHRHAARPPNPRRSSTNLTSKTNNGNRKPRTGPPTPSYLSRFSLELPSAEFMMRVGAVLGSEARDGPAGESWLMSRPSSTSLSALRDPRTPEDYYALEDADEYALARERVLGPTPGARSRRGSVTSHHHHSIVAITAATTPGGNGGGGGSGIASHNNNHNHIASAARKRKKGMPLTPSERRAEILAQMEDDYFGSQDVGNNESDDEAEKIPGPDFVNVDEPLDDEHDTIDEEEDELAMTEAYVRQETKKSWILRSWFVRPFLSDSRLFADDEESEEDEYGGDEEESEISDEEFERRRQERRSAALRRLQECTIIPLDTTNDPPPPEEDKGGWSDAVWLLRVASRSLWG